MRTTTLAAALTVLLAGCGFDSDPTAPEDPGLALPEPARLPGAEFVTAAVTTNIWAPRPRCRRAAVLRTAGVVNGVIYAVGGSVRNALARCRPTIPAPTAGQPRRRCPRPVGSERRRHQRRALCRRRRGRNTADQEPLRLHGLDQHLDDQGAHAGPGRGAAPAASSQGSCTCTAGATTASFQRYDPATNSWKALAVPASPHRHPAAGVVDGKFYLVGGWKQRRLRRPWKSMTPPRMPGRRSPRCRPRGSAPRAR